MKDTEANFDRIARAYRWLEYLTLGRTLERCRCYFLGRVLDRREALVLGDGDGRFLARLHGANPGMRATAVDTSAAMLELLRHRCEAETGEAKSWLRTCNSSALDHVPDGDTDLVIAHFFFDCLSQSDLDTLIGRIARHIRPGALWLISDFRIPKGAMRVPARVLIRPLYLVFRILTGLRTTRIPDHAAPLTRSGLARVAHQYSLGGLLVTELWERPAAK